MSRLSGFTTSPTSASTRNATGDLELLICGLTVELEVILSRLPVLILLLVFLVALASVLVCHSC